MSITECTNCGTKWWESIGHSDCPSCHEPITGSDAMWDAIGLKDIFYEAGQAWMAKGYRAMERIVAVAAPEDIEILIEFAEEGHWSEVDILRIALEQHQLSRE